jgi:hypothetical protein
MYANLYVDIEIIEARKQEGKKERKKERKRGFLPMKKRNAYPLTILLYRSTDTTEVLSTCCRLQ